MSIKSFKELIIFNGDIPLRPGEISAPQDFLLKSDVSPYLAYVILKKNFGSPLFATPASSDDFDKTQWEWTFRYKNFYVNIYDWKFSSVSIVISHALFKSKDSKNLAIRINELLLKEANSFKKKVQNTIADSKQKILENPFITYYSTAENLIEVAEFLENYLSTSYVKKTDTAKKILTQLSNIKELWEKKPDIYRSAFIMFFSSFEGFLNTLYELYIKPELRSNRLYDKISRENLDVKIRMLPVYCDGFKTPLIDNENNRFKNFLKLVNVRNDFIHANLIKSLERYIVYEDNFTFLIENEKNKDIPTNINDLSLEHVLLCKQYIDGIIALIFESMNPKARKEFKRIIFKQEIEVEYEEGILFPV